MHTMFVLTCHSNDNTRQVHDVKIGVVIRADVSCFPSSFQPPLVAASATSRLITSEIDIRFRFISWVWPSNSWDRRLRNNKHLVQGILCYVRRACDEECCEDLIGSRCSFNTLRPRQNGRHFPDDSSKCIFLNENVWISIENSLKFVHRVPIDNNPALVQIMAWCRPGATPLSEPVMV